MARRAEALARAVATALAVALVFSSVATPQTATAPAPSKILTIDPEKLFSETAYGRRVIAESEALAEALQAENREIEAELTAEEKDLTERRPDLPVDEFRKLADAFDAKVEQIRKEQDAKVHDVQAHRDNGQQQFFARISPILLTIVREKQAAILLDRRTVFLSADSVDITDEAVTRIDAAIGAGEAQEEPPAEGGN